MKKIIKPLLISIIFGISIFSCVTTPTPTSLPDVKSPDLIPLQQLFVSSDWNDNYKVSPDGKRLAWIGVKDGRLTILFRMIGRDEVGIINTHSLRGIYWFTWVQDSRRILYAQDQEGNENYHIYLTDTDQPDQKPVDLTPFENTRASVHQIVRSDPEHVLILHNRRDKTVFDLYRVNLNTHAETEIGHNPGDVIEWITDLKGNLRARVRQGTNEHKLEIWNSTQQIWTNILTWDMEDSVNFLGFTPDQKGMWLRSNRGRERIGLVRLDLETAEESLVYEHPQVDLDRVAVSEFTQKPLFSVSYPDYQETHFFDPSLEADFAALRKKEPTGFGFVSFDNQELMATVPVFTDKGRKFYLLNRLTQEKFLLGQAAIADYADSLATVQPISFTSRDGLTLHGYLTLPKGVSGRQLPMVLLVHGGPWARDYWNYSNVVQFLANRGYVVLQINYRGSFGYGRTFMQKAIGEFAGKMHDDLIDGVKWAIKRGIADPEKICIAGASYGGYATLVGLTFTPDVFACGVDIVGMSNLVSLTELAPPYWKLAMPFWHKYVGNPTRSEDRRTMEAKSPLFRADQLKRPLLIIHGANDARVKQQESDQMVAAFRKAGKEVEYMVFPDEGHMRTYGNWKNILKMYQTIEDFLSKYLGGRRSGPEN